MADRVVRFTASRWRLGLALFVVAVAAGACSDGATPENAAGWAEEVETRLVDQSVDRPIVDCVLNVARVDLRRNPLSDAATDELIANCERARRVIDGAAAADEAPVDALAMVDHPFTFGDDPTLDALWGACDEGSGRSCDQLFAAAPVGSDYEEFGVSCGNRPELLYCDELDVEPEDGG